MLRIHHSWDKWECYKAGFYETKNCLPKDEGQEIYKKFLSNEDLFEKSILKVFDKWHFSCQHFLTNESINRIAWIGQASVCIEKRISCFNRGGFKRLSLMQQRRANALAMKYLKKWEKSMQKKIEQFIEEWKLKGYENDIPDECPEVLAKLGLAPSYKAIAQSILKNDNLKSLGFTGKHSQWYDYYKRIELGQRIKNDSQLTFDFS